MEGPGYWGDLNTQFQELLPRLSKSRPLAADQADDGKHILTGGPDDSEERDALHDVFESLAIRGGLGLGVGQDLAFAGWLARLTARSRRTRTVGPVTSRRYGPLQRQGIPADLIFQPEPQMTYPAHVVDEAIPPLDGAIYRCAQCGNWFRISEKGACRKPSEKNERINRTVCAEDEHAHEIIVESTGDGRYALVAGHAKHTASVKEGMAVLSCCVRDPNATISVERDYRTIQHVISASIELCVNLETEAHAAAREGAGSSTQPSAPSMMAAAASGGAEPATERPATVQGSGVSLGPAVFTRRNRRHWRVEFGDERSETVRHVKGLSWMGQLLASPRRAVSAMALLAETVGRGPEESAQVADALHDAYMTIGTGFRNDPQLDAAGRRRFTQQLQDIEAELDGLDPHVQTVRIAELLEEKAAIQDEIKSAKNAGRSGSPRDRARKTAARQYSGAL